MPLPEGMTLEQVLEGITEVPLEALKGKKLTGFKVYGRSEALTAEEAQSRLQQEIAASVRMEEAAEKIKSAEKAIEVINTIKEGWGKLGVDAEQAGRLLVQGLTGAGIPEANAREVVYGSKPSGSGGSDVTTVPDDDDDNDGGEVRSRSSGPTKDQFRAMVGAAFGADPGEVDDLLKAFKARKVVTERTGRLGQIKSALDKDQDFAKLIGRAKSESRDELARTYLDMAEAAVLRRIGTPEHPVFGARAISAGLSDLKAKVKLLGLQPTDGDVPITGSGPSAFPVPDSIHLTEDAQAVLRQLSGDGQQKQGKPLSIYDPDSGKKLLGKIAENLREPTSGE